MTVLYRGAAIMGTPSEIVEALRTWSGFTWGRTIHQYRRDMRRRMWRLYGKRMPISDDGAIISALADVGELHIIARD